MTAYDQSQPQSQPQLQMYRAPVAPRTSGMAIASLVCGIFGFIAPCLVMSLVFGVIARKEIARSNGAVGGDGLAKAGIGISIGWIAMICLGIAISIIAPLMLQASSSGPAAAEEMQATADSNTTRSYLANVHAAIALYRIDHDDAMPPSLQALVDDGLLPTGIFRCAASDVPLDPADVDNTGAFGYSGSGGDAEPVAWERYATRSSADGPVTMVLFGDGRVEPMTPEAINALLAAAY